MVKRDLVPIRGVLGGNPGPSDADQGYCRMDVERMLDLFYIYNNSRPRMLEAPGSKGLMYSLFVDQDSDWATVTGILGIV